MSIIPNLNINSKTNQIKQASKQLNVGTATVRNWLRLKILKSLSPAEIKLLKTKIESGKINKLRTGANRKSATEKFNFHPELLDSTISKTQIKKLNNWLAANKKKPQLVLAVLFSDLCRRSNKSLNRTKVFEQILKKFGTHKKNEKFIQMAHSLKMMSINFDDSFLVYAEQFFRDTATKSKRGAYFTDEKTAGSEIDSVVSKRGIFCDPCCGAGNYLKMAYLKFKKIDSNLAESLVYGYDIDEKSVTIAQARLFVISNGRMKVLQQIKALDVLASNLELTFDFICTNPPWGAELKSNLNIKENQEFTSIKTRESFSLFIIKINKMLKPNGVTGLILPAALVYVKTHAEIRNWIFSNYKVMSLGYSKAKFSSVMSRPISLVLKKTQTNFQKRELSHYFQKQHAVKKIIEKIENLKNCESLKKNAEWALGIVTGNNARFLSGNKQKESEPIIRGVDIIKFGIIENNDFITGQFQDFQQVAPMRLYRIQKKIVYRFIGSEPVFAVDDKGRLTLNSANILIPQIKDISIYAICAVMNSKLLTFFLQQKFQSVKLLRSHIESVPFPCFNSAPEIWLEIDKLSQQLHQKFSDEKLFKINQLVYKLYGITRTESELVERKISKSHLVALKQGVA